MIKNYVDIVQMLDDEMVEIANSEQLEEYVRANYERWAINWMGRNTHVFISGEWSGKLGKEAYRAYKFLIEKNNVELNGVPIKDVVSFRAIIFLSLEEPEFYNITKFKRNEDGDVLNWKFSKDLENILIEKKII